MNIALPALVVFLLLLPGFIARSQIKRAERLSLDYSPFGQIVSEAVVWAGGLHIVWIFLSTTLSGLTFRADVVLKLLSATPEVQVKALDAVAAHVQAITVYFATQVLFAYLGPAGVRGLITWRRWDRINSRLSGALRFSRAPWYYLLSGADFDKDDSPDLIAVSAIVVVANEAHLYTGILEDYFIDPEGNLDRLILQQVMRRPLKADKGATLLGTEPGDVAPADRFYPIDGDYFVLRYSEAITLNIEYIKLTEQVVDLLTTDTAPAPAFHGADAARSADTAWLTTQTPTPWWEECAPGTMPAANAAIKPPA